MKAAVLGKPISHSLSPIIHNAAYQLLDLPHVYEAIELDEESFIDFMANLKDDWLGFSLTMPLKEVAFDVTTEVSTVAKLTNSINTLICQPLLRADNTDVFGISQALRFGGCNSPKTATIIGAGATARSAIVALEGLGIEVIQIFARNLEKSARCIDLGNQLGITVDSTTEFSNNLVNVDVVINTTPKGVADEYSNRIESPTGCLLDVIYDPWPTKLAKVWLESGLTVIPGYQMLLHQAIRQIELMTGLSPDVENLQTALAAEIAKRGISN